MDLSPAFNEALRRHDKPPIKPHAFDLDGVEAFVKEAYRIVSRRAPPTWLHLSNASAEQAHLRAQPVPPLYSPVLPFSSATSASEPTCAHQLVFFDPAV